MNEQNYEQEINLGKVFYRIFRDWRKIFVLALIIAVLLGSGNFVLKRIKTTSSEYMQKAEESYNRELVAHRALGETLQAELTNLEESRQKQEEYNANSILMKINPLREFNASLQLYVSTDYQIVPELTYQNIDLSNRILRSYVTYMANGDMYQHILKNLSTPVELRYLQEVFSVLSDYDNRMVTLNVRGVDAAFCEEVLSLALEGIQAKQQELIASIGTHDLNAINQSAYEAVNLDLDTFQKNNLQMISALSIQMQEKAEELTDWELTPEPEQEYTIVEIIKSSIKMMIIGFIVGAVVIAVYIAFRYIATDKLQDSKELKDRFGLRVIAQLPKTPKKRLWVGIDRMFAKMAGLLVKESEVKQLAQVAAMSMSAELADEKANKNSVNLVFTGNVVKEEIEKILEMMKWESGYSVKSAASILNDSAAVTEVNAADYVVLVEKQEESSCTQIESELEQLKAWKKKVLGVIVLGVDAIP